MLSIRSHSRAVAALVMAIVFAAVMLHTIAIHAQTSVSGSGLGTLVNGSLGTACTSGTCTVTGGTLSSNSLNLFHSFDKFSVTTGNTAQFGSGVNNAALQNIVARVTGTDASRILGTINSRSFFSNANLFLLNPNGFLFGAGASLNVGGAFRASTANSLSFDDGTRFFVNPALTSTFSGANPRAFVFDSAPLAALPDAGCNLANICVKGMQYNAAVAAGAKQTISLVGGNIEIVGPAGPTTATIGTTGGRIDIASVAASGEVVFRTSAGAPDLNVASFSQLGRINISGSARVDSSGVNAAGGAAAGTVVIRGGQLFVSGASSIRSNNFSNTNAAPIAVDIQAPNIAFNAASVQVATTRAGNAGQVNLQSAGGAITMTGGAFIDSNTAGAGAGADVSLSGASVSLTGVNTRISSATSTTGKGGALTVTTNGNTVIISGSGSGIFSTTTSTTTGVGGAVTIISPSLTLADSGTIVTRSNTSSSLARAGDITIGEGQLGSVTITGGGNITSRTINSPGGNVTLNITGSATISGTDAAGNPSGIVSGSSSTGAPGGISVNATRITLADKGEIRSGSLLDPQGGGITLNALQSIDILNAGAIRSQASTQNVSPITVSSPSLTIDGGSVEASTVGSGNAGAILVNGGSGGTVTIIDGGQIASNSSTSGTGGSVTINTGAIAISGASPNGVAVGSLNNDTHSGIFSTAQGSGNAGQINLTAPTLTMADGGKISVATSGSGNAGNIALNVNSFTQTGGARVDSSTASGGRGGDLTVTAANSATISGAGTGLFSTASSTGNAGQITVSAPGLTPVPTLTIADGAKITVATSGAGNAGSVSLNANTLNLTGGAQVVSSTGGAGQGGSLAITANSSATVSGAGSGLFSTASNTGNAGQITVSAASSAPVPTLTIADNAKISVATTGTMTNAGDAGSVSLIANNLNLTGGAQVVSSTEGTGLGGSVTVNSPTSVSISGTGSAPSGLFSTASGSRNAGEISVTTPTLAMSSGGTISVATSGAGNAGNIALNVTNFNQSSGARVDSSTSGSGDGGDLTLTATNSANISGSGSGLFSTASSIGDAGQITVSAPSLAPVPTLTIADGAKITVATSGAGNAGSVSLNANTLNLTGGAQVISSTNGAGQGGSVAIAATDSMSISGSGGGLFSTASSTGNAGQINVTTPTLTMGEGGTISVATSGAGNAGNIALNVNSFTQTSGARVDSSTASGGRGGDLTVTAANSATISGAGSGLFSTASGTGAGGNITLQAKNIQLNSGGTISANSTGTATASAGDINVIFGDRLSMVNGSITTAANLADGGNISITATGSTLLMTDSQVITSVASGVGKGGNITIGSTSHPFDFIILKDSQIRADAFGGPGGNVNIKSDVYLKSNSVVSASSQLSTPGTIAIEATFTDVSGSVAQLPETPLKATDLLRASCAARFAGGKLSSLVLSGRDGLPIQPGGLSPSPLYLASDVSAPTAGVGSSVQGLNPRYSLLGSGSKNRLLTQYSLLPNAKCAF